MTQPLPTPPPAEPDPDLGRVVRRLREEQGFTAIDLAEQAGLETATVEQIENGAIDPPWAAVEAIARALDVSVESIASAVAEQRPD